MIIEIDPEDAITLKEMISRAAFAATWYRRNEYEVAVKVIKQLTEKTAVGL